MEREVTKSMLDDMLWIHRTMSTMRGTFNKKLTAEFTRTSIEFVKGALWQKEQSRRERLILEDLVKIVSENNIKDSALIQLATRAKLILNKP